MSMNKHGDEWFSTFAREVMNLKRSIPWVGIANQLGMIIKETYREDLRPLMTAEENLEYAANTIARQKERRKYESKIGKVVYAFGSYRKIRRATIPINEEYYLLLTFNKEATNADEIIMKKVIPLIEKHKHKFVV
jgi:hypothetical protein